MELPEQIKALYRHWQYHTASGRRPTPSGEIFKDKKMSDDIALFVRERMSIWKKKHGNETPPFTTDTFLASYRFCNILRELDRQTIEFHTLLNPLRDNFPLWLLNMFYCRMVARPETVLGVGLLSFDKKENNILYKRLVAHPRPRYGTPYVFPVSTIMRSPTPTRELFIAKYLPGIMKAVAQEIETWSKSSVADGVDKIISIFGFNLKFLWTEVLIDVAYQYPDKINLFERFPVGPGALPTFKKINVDVRPEDLAAQLSRIQFDSGLTYNGRPVILSAENWEGVGCEYRKYTNLKLGKGRKRLFAKKKPR